MTMGRWELGLLLLAIAGCSSKSGDDVPTTAPIGAEQQRAADGILEKQLEVDTLYLAEDGKESIAPGNRQGVIVEPGTGKLAWAAWECNNPSCPGRRPEGKPLLFPRPNPLYFAKQDGTAGLRQPTTEAELLEAQDRAEVKCPACLKTRNLAAETPEQRQQYQFWCRAYVLPQAAEQRQQLAEEYRRLRATVEGGK